MFDSCIETVNIPYTFTHSFCVLDIQCWISRQRLHIHGHSLRIVTTRFATTQTHCATQSGHSRPSLPLIRRSFRALDPIVRITYVDIPVSKPRKSLVAEQVRQPRPAPSPLSGVFTAEPLSLPFVRITYVHDGFPASFPSLLFLPIVPTTP